MIFLECLSRPLLVRTCLMQLHTAPRCQLVLCFKKLLRDVINVLLRGCYWNLYLRVHDGSCRYELHGLLSGTLHIDLYWKLKIFKPANNNNILLADLMTIPRSSHNDMLDRSEDDDVEFFRLSATNISHRASDKPHYP